MGTHAGAMLRPPSLACHSHATLGASLPGLACVPIRCVAHRKVAVR
jgi:hypothetical protein